MGSKKQDKKKDILTFKFDGTKYVYDGILAFIPTLIEDEWVVTGYHNRVFRLPLDCLRKTQLSDGRAIYVISNIKHKVVADYLFENMSYLATREGISGKKWDDLIEA